MLKEFRAFMMRGNVLELAVAFIVGGAFGKIVTSLVNDIIMPPVGLLLGRVDFSNLFIDLSRKHYSTLAQAKAAGAPTINYGTFLNTIVNFLIVSFALFILIRQFNRFKKPVPVSAPTTKTCNFCLSEIAIAATRCPHCTSHLEHFTS